MRRRLKRVIKVKPAAVRKTGHGAEHDTGRGDLFKMAGLLAVFTTTFAALVVLQANRLPADAKQYGDNWLNVSLVNQGLYCCRIYSKEKKLIKKQAYMLPYKYWRENQRELTAKVQKYDGDTILLDGGMELLACEVPYQAEMIRSGDGLVWVKYEAVKEENNMYLCEIYSTKDGKVISSGAYVLKKYRWDKDKNKTIYENAEENARLFNLLYYGGVSISMKNEMVLMPAGVIDYCTGPGSGLRVKYDGEGNEIKREEY